jgi:hypothetical protein
LSGTQQSAVGGGDGEGEIQKLFFEPRTNSRPSAACLAPKHNNKQQPFTANEQKMRPLFASEM